MAALLVQWPLAGLVPKGQASTTAAEAKEQGRKSRGFVQEDQNDIGRDTHPQNNMSCHLSDRSLFHTIGMNATC